MTKRSFPGSRLIDLVNQESDYPRKKLLLFAVMSGMSNGLLLAVINHGAGSVGSFAESRSVQVYHLALFIVILTLFVYTKRHTLEQGAILVEEVLRKVRMRIADKIRHTELEFIERAGYSEIYNCLSQDTAQISQSSTVIFAAVEASIMLSFAMLYIAWLTPEGFVLTLSALALGAWVFLIKREGIIRDLDMATKHEILFFESLNHTLAGFKEVKINRAKSRDLFSHQGIIAADVQRYKSRAGVSAVFVMMFSEVYFYILIATVLFVWPYFQIAEPGLIVKLTMTILFMIGPLDLLFGSVPLFIKADLAVNNLKALESKVDAVSRGVQVGEPVDGVPLVFERLGFRDVHFEFQDSEGAAQFTVGPINLDLRAGEILFIVGGNGSGKSTLLKLLTGLYYPASGKILVNDEILDKDIYPDFREMFSIIFTDFHLFNRQYGVKTVDENRVKALIKKLGLAGKTKFRDASFTNTNLSTGQRKRLAYISAILEDKQIYVFDELAADQDPEFRREFYQVLLPELRGQGKTIVAVTHDDKYFSAADRVLRMDEGQFVELTPK